ncbi:MAG: ATP-binding protein [Nitriliruptorales bacterium]|nr:ATP-binding protein [Nitriliruptorales bacterium]
MSTDEEEPGDEAGTSSAGSGVTMRRLSQALDSLAEVQADLDEERLRRFQAEALLDRLFTSMSDAVLVVDPHGEVVRASGAAPRLFGRPEDELIGSVPEGWYEDEVPLRPWDLLERAPSGQLHLETVVQRPDGSSREVSLSCTVIRDRDGKVTGAVHAARDLSNVHYLLREVRAAEQRWRLLAHVGARLSEALDPEDVLGELVTYLGGETELGVALLLTDDGVIEVVHLSPDVPDGEVLDGLVGTAPSAGSSLAAVLADGQTVHAPAPPSDFPLAGPALPAMASAAVLPLTADDRTFGAMIVASPEARAVREEHVDLFEEVAARIALSIANARLQRRIMEHRAEQEAVAYRDRILEAISHEMKTPLAVLTGQLKQLKTAGGSVEPAALEKIVASVDRQVIRLRRLVTQFLDYIRVEAGHELAVSTRPVDVRSLVETTAETVADEGRLRLDLPADLPPAEADTNRLDLALANLISNALKYAPSSTPVTVTGREAGRHVEISVTDEGPGIPISEQPRLFDKFARGSEESGVEGSGLGLYMTRQMMHSQGGEVRLSSRPGEGSRFTLVLPRSDVEDEGDNDEQ